MRAGDALKWRVHARVDKWDADAARWALARTGTSWLSGADLRQIVGPAGEVVEADGNMLLTAGLNRLTSLLIGGGGQALTNTSGRIGAGNSSTAEAAGQTDLQAAAGAGNRYFQPMDATYPQQSNGVVTVRATFGTGDGNFQWSEWGVDIGAPTVAGGTTVNAVLLNRKVAALGTKASGAIWTITATITIS